MLSNAEFAQLTGIPQSAMPALPTPQGSPYLQSLQNPNLAEAALFTIPIACEDGRVRGLWRVRKTTVREHSANMRQDAQDRKARRDRERAANVARYADLARKRGLTSYEGCEAWAQDHDGAREVGITDEAIHRASIKEEGFVFCEAEVG